MIRKFRPDDIDAVLKMGFESFKKGNSFLKMEFVEEHHKMAKELIPYADIYIYEENGKVLGSVVIVDNGYILGVNVDISMQRRSMGTKLINYCKSKYKNLNADVFAKNSIALNFFKKNGFEIVGEKFNLELNEKEYEMKFLTIK